MTDERPGRRRLRLVRGGGRSRLAGVEIEIAPRERSPFPVDAVAVEDDTYGVLAADPAFRESTEHPIRAWTGLKDFVEREPGTVRSVAGRPVRLLAVVHDLALDPTWKEEWVGRALAGILAEADRRRWKSLALAPLGAVHGEIAPQRFVALLRAALEDGRPPALERIWIVAPSGRVDALRRALAEV